MPSSFPYIDPSYSRVDGYHTLSLERSTIKTEDHSEAAQRIKSQHEQGDDHVTPPLFSPSSHHIPLNYDVPRSRQLSFSVSPTMSNDARLPSPPATGSGQHGSNRMSLSSLCSPTPSSSLPPHMARANGAYDATARLSHSPSSVASPLSSPPYAVAALSINGSVPPPSPSIAVIDQPQKTMTPAPFVTATSTSPPPPLRPVQVDSASNSMKRKRTSPSAESPGTQVDELDERTKTWKHATGFRRDLTSDKLTQPDAPTRRKRQSMLPATAATAANTMAARSSNSVASAQRRRGSTASHHSGSGDSIALGHEPEGPNDSEDDELLEAASAPLPPAGGLGVTFDSADSGTSGTSATRLAKKRKSTTGTGTTIAAGITVVAAGEYSPSPSSPAPSSSFFPGASAGGGDNDDIARLEKKRRQNTQAARRSRIRKAEEVQKLQTTVVAHEAQIAELQKQLAELARDKNRVDGLLKQETDLSGVLKNIIVETVGQKEGQAVLATATQRWRAIVATDATSSSMSVTSSNGQKMDIDAHEDYHSEERSTSGS